MFCRPKRPTDPQLYSAGYLPHCLHCLLNSLKFILHPNTRTWSMITQTAERHSTATGVPYQTQSPWTWSLEENNKWREVEKKRNGRSLSRFWKTEAWKAKEKKNDRGRETCVSLFVLQHKKQHRLTKGKQTKKTKREWVKGYREMRGTKELHKREELDQIRTDEGRQ